MIDIIKEIATWNTKGKNFAMATVIKTWRSSPRPVGAVMCVDEEGNMLGSVSGGCVENTVVRISLEVLSSRNPRIEQFGVSDEEAWEVGLSCGGELTVFIEPFIGSIEKNVWNEIHSAYEKDSGIVLLTQLSGAFKHSSIDKNSKITGSSVSDHLLKEVLLALSGRQTKTFICEDQNYLAMVFPQKNRMILIGSAHITSEMIGLAHLYHFKTIVIDPRETFIKKTYFGESPDEIYTKWPQEILNEIVLDQDTYAVILSHDPKIDDEALKILLKSNVRYIGALGSKKTHIKRVDRLKSYGFNDADISKIHAPIGIAINATSAGEIALSIISEIVCFKNDVTFSK